MRILSIITLLQTVGAFTSAPSSFVAGSILSQTKSATSSSTTTLCMKTIAVFGASGLTSSECVYQALKNGDKVVGLTRFVIIACFGFVLNVLCQSRRIGFSLSNGFACFFISSLTSPSPLSLSLSSSSSSSSP